MLDRSVNESIMEGGVILLSVLPLKRKINCILLQFYIVPALNVAAFPLMSEQTNFEYEHVILGTPGRILLTL
jgi:hypothetical protein